MDIVNILGLALQILIIKLTLQASLLGLSRLLPAAPVMPLRMVRLMVRLILLLLGRSFQEREQ